MMTLNWGPYVFPTVNPMLTIERPPIMNEREERMGYTEIWKLKGKLISPTGSQQELTALASLLEEAFRDEGRDLSLSLVDGSPSVHQLLDSQCFGGTRVTRLVSYPTTEGAEYVTYRSYEIEVQGDVYDKATALSLWDFAETVAVTGTCGPITGWLLPKNGVPIQQLFKNQSTCRAIQSGSAKGMFDYPEPPGPIWPGYEQLGEREIIPGPPKRQGDGLKLYPLEWKYIFESDVPLIGVPSTL